MKARRKRSGGYRYVKCLYCLRRVRVPKRVKDQLRPALHPECHQKVKDGVWTRCPSCLQMKAWIEGDEVVCYNCGYRSTIYVPRTH